ncbi:hypothetical protein DCS_07612 [Drechmeria coniospora]|uniref:Uncharacterized protein n=1 Tax=Drechmeria coniospora TaxID=98403 RepID=A0A151GEY1_DRECN|nr:hypothetical protein DCS_07612 [Drechmeria coniospora]KYK55648.1 hypothetical protein DCS_07612 [Drechmeria coniospora]ODA81750.1 hypothetical protein RJ55_00253 [Drechmeria coniospora]
MKFSTTVTVLFATIASAGVIGRDEEASAASSNPLDNILTPIRTFLTDLNTLDTTDRARAGVAVDESFKNLMLKIVRSIFGHGSARTQAS